MTPRAGPGVLCLQGGRELTSACIDMDRAVLERCDGAVAILAGAARPGSDYVGASARTVEYYRGLGAEVVVVPDPRSDPGRARVALTDDVGLIVMPGGAPGGLLDVLTIVDGGSIGARIVELWLSGAGMSGASAGAMVMCTRTAIPDRRAGAGNGIADGLGLVAGMAVPHWSPGFESRWEIPESTVWGLPECGGVVLQDDRMSAVGQGTPSIRISDAWHAVTRVGTEELPT